MLVVEVEVDDVVLVDVVVSAAADVVESVGRTKRGLPLDVAAPAWLDVATPTWLDVAAPAGLDEAAPAGLVDEAPAGTVKPWTWAQALASSPCENAVSKCDMGKSGSGSIYIDAAVAYDWGTVVAVSAVMAVS